MGVEKDKKKTVGDFNQLGWYTLFVCVTYELLVVSQVSNLIYMIFGGAVAEIGGCGDDVFANMSTKEKCAKYEKLEGDGCHFEDIFQSVNYEYGYVCSSARTVKLSTSIQMIGIMFGAMIFGQLSDTFGRRNTLIFGTIGLIVSGTISTFANGIVFFTIARFFVMFFTGGKHSVSYVYMMETLPTKHRMWIVTVITYSPNYIVFTALAYLTGDWRSLSRVVAAITFIPLIMLFFVRETPRWLVLKEKIDQAREALITIGKWDGCNTPEHIANVDSILEKERERIRENVNRPKQEYSIYHLFKYRQFAKYTVFFSYSLITTSVISYGLMFNFEKLSGSPYLNTIIIGSLRYLINLVVAVVDIEFKWAGRRLLHTVAMSFMAVGMLLVFAIIVFGLEWESVIRIAALSVSAMGSQIYILNAIAPSELFPTAIRNKGMGFVQTFNRVGNVLAPQAFLLADIWIPLPYLAMGLMGMLEVVLFLIWIPETKGKPLPDRMPDEVEHNVDEERDLSRITLEDEKVCNEQVPLNEISK